MKIKIARNKITNEANKHLQIIIAQREIYNPNYSKNFEHRDYCIKNYQLTSELNRFMIFYWIISMGERIFLRISQSGPMNYPKKCRNLIL